MEYETYLTTLLSPTAFSGTALVKIMTAFQTPFVTHFHNEISTIASFANLPTAPAPNSQPAEDAALVFKTWGKKTVNVCYKRVTRTSERRTPPTLRTSPISIYNGSTQRYSITLK
jgi:hypothetical protein